MGTDHKLYYWGSIVGTRTLTPQRMTGFPEDYNFKKVELGSNNGMCGILLNDEVVCWGYNTDGRFAYPSLNTLIGVGSASKIMDTQTGTPLKVKDLIIPNTSNIYFIKK